MTVKKRWSRMLAALLAIALLIPPAALAAEEGTAVTIGTGITERPEAEVTVKWDDAWFTVDADVYQHELAVTAMALSAAAYVRTAQGVSVQKAMEAFGFQQVRSYNYQFSAQSSEQTAYTLAVKTVKDRNNKAVRLVAAVIRGTGVYTEWAGNLNVGAGNEHAGFAQARDELMDNLEKYLEETGAAVRLKRGWRRRRIFTAIPSPLRRSPRKRRRRAMRTSSTPSAGVIWFLRFLWPSGATAATELTARCPMEAGRTTARSSPR